MIALTVNGVAHALDIDPSMPLLYALRNHLELNGAKFGCGMGQCGSCTVIVDKQAVFSCQFPVSSAQGRQIRTIEGLGTIEHPSPLQKAFIDKQAAQCGYCIAGMVMRAQALLDSNPSPTEDEIRAHMQTNLCRCGTHMRILAAVREAAVSIRAAGANGSRAGGSPAGGGDTGSGQAGNAQAGGGQAGNAQAGGGQAGNGQAGNGQAGTGTNASQSSGKSAAIAGEAE